MPVTPTATGPTAEVFVRRLLAASDPDKRRALIAGHTLVPSQVHDTVMRLVDEAERLYGIDPIHMERVCVDALALAQRGADDYGWAMARMRHGEALRVQGRNSEARLYLDEAAATFVRLGKPIEAARTRVSWIWATAGLGRIDEARSTARAARRILVEHGLTLRVATLDTNMGNILLEHGQHRAALRQFTAALALYRSLGDSGTVGVFRCHANRGIALTRLGRHRDALTELEMARKAYQQMGEKAGFARVMRGIGENRMALGRYASALLAFDEAQSSMRALEMRADAASLARMVADCYLMLNRPVDALSALDNADEDLVRTDNALDALGIATRRVASHLLLGDREQALAVLNEAEQRFPTGALQHRAWLAAQRAAVLLSDDQPVEALATARGAARLAKAAGVRRITADSLVTEGAALLALGNPSEAARLAGRARRMAGELHSASTMYRAFELLGKVAEARNQTGIAGRYYAAAIHQVERERQGVIFEYRDSLAADRNVAYERLAILQIRAGKPVAALSTVERAKSRALADAISGSINPRPRPGTPTNARRIARELSVAREDYAAAYVRASRDEPDDKVSPADRAAMSHDLSRRETSIAALVRRLQLAGATGELAEFYGAAIEPAVPAVPADTVLLEFFTSDDDLLRFRVDAGGVRAEILPGAMAEVERLLRAFRVNLDATEQSAPDGRDRLARQAQQVLYRLHGRLLGGLQELDTYKSLVIVPHGLLHYLPFHALHDGEQYLVERFAISYAPSAALYDICRARRPRHTSALVLAHSAGGTLPFVRTEAAAIAAVTGGTVYEEGAATRALLETAGRRAGLLHIAAHGRFRPDAPLFSCIELADGPLTTADVFNLNLSAALVTLSACETGRAVIGGGDELAGLARAFLFAGAAGLVVSQWRVDDASTGVLMTRFYQELGRGAGRAEALRTAQMSAISSVMSQNGILHPFFWAGFQVIGDNQGVKWNPTRARGR